MSHPVKCLLVYPEFTMSSFWNFRATCKLFGAKYPTAPLGLITVAAMLPPEWEIRLVDCNVESLHDADLAWADLVLTGGMLAQQRDTLAVIDRAKRSGKTVVVGGPDATSSPHIYDQADYQVLGEAEITLPCWLADFNAAENDLNQPALKQAPRRYEPGSQRADMSKAVRPRFDLLRFDRYLYLGVQFARGCPFLCEFCDIIELFGRVPRLKSATQLLGELQQLYDLGYRGHLEFVDDNFIGNKRDVKKFLPRLIAWQQAHGWPFQFGTEASINLADDDELLGLMQQAGFCMVFAGIESPDEETLTHMQKRQNTRRSLADSIRKIYAHGMVVTTGYILGFDTEGPQAAQGVVDLIEDSATAVNMVGTLFALPGTQLSRRLAGEGRLHDNFDRVGDSQHGDQCSGGLNFTTARPRRDILRDYRRIIAETYAPAAYFGRIGRMALLLNCEHKTLGLPLRRHLHEFRGFLKLALHQGILAPHRQVFWATLLKVLRANPQALRYAVAVMGLYQHFGPFHKYLLGELDGALAAEEAQAAPAVPLGRCATDSAGTGNSDDSALAEPVAHA
jgi:radical SAM superfamily enzyme YgiQ (UPF0313 family)